MSKKIFFCCLALVVSIIPLISCSPSTVIKDHLQFLQQAERMLRENSNNRSIEFPYDPLLNSLCANNEDGDYPDPYYCNFIIKCSGQTVFLEVCSPDTLNFNPFFDGCVNAPSATDIQQCPSWPSVWSDPTNVRCETLGQVPWGGAAPVIFPANPEEVCGSDIIFCKDFKQVTDDKPVSCNDGCGYSKAFFGCLPLDTCTDVDSQFINV